MASVTNFMYCANVKRHEDNPLHVDAENVISQIVMENIPGNLSFSIMLSVFNEEGFTSKDTIELLFSEKDGNNIVGTGEVNLPPIDAEMDLPIAFTMSWDLKNINFQTEGVYFTRIRINGEEIYSAPIAVRIAKEDKI
ncbi:MAG: DUF6941 family protein [Clostridia bacterium]